MYSISKVSEVTGISAYTLRYYEKIGLLPEPERTGGGVREYSDKDVRFVHFLSSLKRTGMSLEEITEFVKDGCVLDKMEKNKEIDDLKPSIDKRIQILTKHLSKMESQIREMEDIVSLTKEKLSFYQTVLANDRREE